jgi:hypothetical protein
MISCSCAVGHEGYVEILNHEDDCNFLKNTIQSVVPLKTPKPRQMWSRLLTYEGDTEWVEKCRGKSLLEGITTYGGNNTITATTVCVRMNI